VTTELQRQVTAELGQVIQRFGEALPHKTIVVRGVQGAPNKRVPQVNIPNGLFASRVALFQELKRAGRLPTSFSQNSFLNTLKHYFPHVCFLKWTPFSKCDVCVSLKQNIFGSTDEGRARLQPKLQAHRDTVALARLCFAVRTAYANCFPQFFLCLNIDGMDNAKTFSPHVSTSFTASKALSNKGTFLKTKLLGVLSEGFKFTGYFTYPHYGGGPNTLCSCIHMFLVAYVKKNGSQPSTLFLQLDNCGGDNKNHTVFGYLGYLVQEQVFTAIYVNFLPVGKYIKDGIPLVLILHTSSSHVDPSQSWALLLCRTHPRHHRPALLCHCEHPSCTGRLHTARRCKSAEGGQHLPVLRDTRQ
jgi:hypothetical protein